MHKVFLLKISCLVLCLLGLGSSMLVLAETPDIKIVKSQNDNRSYRYLVFPNQLQVLLISDTETEKSAVSLDVNVGSGDDPETRPGLAHFLEHMLFLGTKKYPQAGEYQQYMSSHGGRHNAFTSLEHTNYFFDIEPQFLPQAIDRFSQFFIAPLMDAQYVERERNAVHSEFTAKYQHEGRRSWDVYREIFNPANKSASFGVGNQTTLADHKNKKVRDDLLRFYDDNYSANIMRLVILGKEPLEDLEKLARQHFSQIKNTQVKISQKTVPLFEKDVLPARVFIKPQQEQRGLSLNFPIPSFEQFYKEKPVAYIGYILGHEGRGSLFDLWKNRGWAESLSAGASIANNQSASFSVSMSLTEAGYRNQKTIIREAFQMITLLQEKGVEKWRYNEQKVILDNLFRFQEKGSPLHYVSQLSNNLHYYAAEDVIYGAVAMQNFNPDLIQQYLQYLNPNNVLIEVSGPDVKTDQVSHYYKTEYKKESLKESEWKLWSVKIKNRNQSLQLPRPNEFAAKNFNLKRPGRREANENPVLLLDKPNIRLWFHQDQQFKVPRSGINLYARSVHSVSGVKGAALTAVFVQLLNRHINDFSYVASLAGLNLAVSSGSRGINISIEGFNDKQGLLLSRVLDAASAPVFTQKDLDDVKEEVLRELKNQSRQSPYQQLRQSWQALLSKTEHERGAYQHAIEKITLETVHVFSQKWLQSLNADVLIHGNVTESDALKLSAIIDSKLLLSGKLHHDPQGLFIKLAAQPKPSLYTFSVDHSDVATLYYVQGAGDNIAEQAKMSLLAQLMSADFFNQLRTDQQLGYVVYAGYYPLARVPGMGFIVQSPNHSAEKIDKSVKGFLGGFAKRLASMPAAEFEQYRSALLYKLNETPKNLSEQGSRWWADIAYRYWSFDHRVQKTTEIKNITQKSLADYYWKTFLAPEKRSLWVVAQPESKKLGEQWQNKFQKVKNVPAFKSNKEFFVLK